MIERRRVLQGMAAAGGAWLLPRMVRGAALPEYPFKLGVSSGFPTDRSVILWTRLAPQPDQPGGGMAPADWPLRYEVAHDENFKRIVKRGEVTAAARFAHSVHAEVHGLDPVHDYWYRFIAGAHVSGIGRTRTLPPPRADVDRLRIIAACCQNYEHGHYAALRHMAAESPDLVLYLGDYIYDGAPSANRVRRHTGGSCVTLDDYRQRYALYQSDPALQAAHAAAPWFATWDDHEVVNDYAGLYPGRQQDPSGFAAQRTAAYQAWYEHLPAPPSMAPQNGVMRIYARAQLGRLATLHLLDQRQYRSPEACPKPPLFGGQRVTDDCTERLDPARTMLGAEQERWFAESLKQQQGAWTLLAQGTPFGHINEAMADRPEYWTDAWTGYPAARQRLMDSLQAARAANPVIIGGDIHAFVIDGVNAVPERFDSPLAASELVTTSISSDPLAASILERWRSNSPNLQRLDGSRRGYLALTLSKQQLRTDLVTIDDVRRPDAARGVTASYVVESGNPVILPA